MKLVIQIPCFDEEDTLPAVLADLPKAIPGIDEIQVVVINDGSSDRTALIAHMLGAYVVNHTGNKGLAAAFQTGLDTSLPLARTSSSIRTATTSMRVRTFRRSFNRSWITTATWLLATGKHGMLRTSAQSKNDCRRSARGRCAD